MVQLENVIVFWQLLLQSAIIWVQAYIDTV